MLCKVCGAQIPDDAQECEFCGTKVNEDASAAEETKVINTDEIENAYQEHQAELNENLGDEQNDNSEEQENSEGDEIYDDNERRRREQVKKMMEDKKQQLSEIERRRNEKRKRQRRNRIVLIGAICALAVAAAGIGVYYLVSNVNGGNKIEDTPAPSVAVVSTPSVIATPAVSEEPVQTPELSMETSPRDENSTSSNSQSWSATGNTGSGTSASRSGSTSSSGTTSKSNTSKGSSSTSSKGTGSSGSSSSTSSSSGTGSSSNTSSAQNSGVSSSNISSQLSTGGEVIYESNARKHLMTFVTNNVKYYATVSAGSTTEQINGKPYTITAVPTSETYNGNTVYEITSITNYAGDYILANSGTKLLTNDDIKGMSKHDLALARNEIYARHGRKFQTEEYSKYFSGKSWYSINPNYNYSDDDSNLNSIEVKNVQFILNAERN